MPVLDTFLVPTYEKTGPYGAKSVSEISINGALPAIGNAIKNAVGVRLTRPPFTAEKVLAAMKELKKEAPATKKAAAKPAKQPVKAAKTVKPTAKKAPATKKAKK